MKTVKTKIALFAAAAAVAGAGCRTTEEILRDYERDFSAGNYEKAAEEVSKLSEDKDKNECLWRLHAGTALMFAGKNKEALEQFNGTEDVFENEDAKSVFAQTGDGALAMLNNDTSFNYDGGGQDRIFTCLYKAQIYASLGHSNATRSELNRSQAHQDMWLDERKKDISAAAERLEQDSAAYRKEKGEDGNAGDDGKGAAGALADKGLAESIYDGCGYDMANGGRIETLSRKDYVNAYASHVNGIFRWLDGSGGQASLREVAELRRGNATLARDAAECASAVKKPSGQIWVYVEDGLCPVREEWRIDLPLFLIPGLNKYVLYSGMAFPKLRKRAAAGAGWRVSNGSAVAQMEMLQDVDALMKTEYDVYMRGALAREITRTIVKTGTQIALGIAEHNASGRAKTMLMLSRIAAAGWHAGTVGADIRSWTALPQTVWETRIDRPASGKIEIASATGKYAVDVPHEGNAMVFFRIPSAAAQPSVRVVRLP